METNKRLAQEYLENKLSEENREKFFKLLKDKDMLEELAQLFEEDVYSKMVFESDLVNDINSDEIYGKLKNQIESHKKIDSRFTILKVAASVLLPLLIVAAGLWYVLKPSESNIVWNEFYVPKGETSQIILADGSKVTLNSETKLTYPTDFKGDRREVKLDGEAYFEVQSNQSNPFYVNGDGVTVKVTGTHFNINNYKANNLATIELYEGSVTILKSDKSEEKLLPSQQIVVNKANGASTISINPCKTVVWKDDKVVFENMRLADIAPFLQKRFGAEFSIKDAKIGEYQYYLTLEKPTLNEIMVALEQMAPVKFEQVEPNKYIIKRAK